MYTLLLLLQANFIKRRISGTRPFIGAYKHYNKTYTKSYNSLKEKVLKKKLEIYVSTYVYQVVKILDIVSKILRLFQSAGPHILHISHSS